MSRRQIASIQSEKFSPTSSRGNGAMAKNYKNALIGACGEYYLAAYLSRFDLIVALPRAGIPGADLLVAHEKGGPAIRMQVKTGTQSKKSTKRDGTWYEWHTSTNVIALDDKQLWYAFVWLNEWPKGLAQPELFFVPSHVVAACLGTCGKDQKWTSFWMSAGEADRYRGEKGLGAILTFLKPSDADSSLTQDSLPQILVVQQGS